MHRARRSFDMDREEIVSGVGNSDHAYAALLRTLLLSAIKEAEYQYGGKCVNFRTQMIRRPEEYMGGKFFEIDMMMD